MATRIAPMDTMATIRFALVRSARGQNSQRASNTDFFHLHEDRLFSSTQFLGRSQQAVYYDRLFCLTEGGKLQKTIPYGVEWCLIFGLFDKSKVKTGRRSNAELCRPSFTSYLRCRSIPLVAIRGTHQTGLRNKVRIRHSLLRFIFPAYVRKVILRGRKGVVPKLQH
jgi:hypothetical protein